ncbi:MAG: hypothetical protein IPF87_00160 [Gemmatimonadetes bacterium]|nr:hypothetical protein [Gemmatimonadota bacterium]
MRTRLLPASPPTPDAFRERARAAFSFLIEAAGCHEEPTPPLGFQNPVAVWFANGTTRVVVEGVNWGKHVRVALGRTSGPFENLDLGDLVAERAPEAGLTADEPHVGQFAELSRMAEWLRVFGAEILSGDFRVFPLLEARVEQRRAQIRASRHAP